MASVLSVAKKQLKLVIFRVNSWFLWIKIMKNEANFNSLKLTATTCNIGGYNDSHPKTQNGTKPNEANFFTSPRPHFNAELFAGNAHYLQNLFLRNKPNFNHSNITATSYVTLGYDTSQTKPKNGANPNKPNQSQFKKRGTQAT